MSLVSVVVPVYHNAQSLPDLFLRLRQVAERAAVDFEFVFVDDGSKDDSFAVLKSFVREDPRARAIRLVRNFGADAASSAGFSVARGDAVVALSADLQDPPELILEMISKWREGFRIVLATRTRREDGWFIRMTSWIFWWLFRKLAVPTMPPGGCDYLLVDRVVLDQLADLRESGGGVARILWTGYQPAILGYTRQKRLVKYGKSKWSLVKRVRHFVDMFVTFTDFPLRASSVLGILLALVGAIYAVLLVLGRIIDNAFPPGWAVSMVAFLVISGVQLLMIGVLGEYWLRGMTLLRQRPTYLIDTFVDSTTLGKENQQSSKHPANKDAGADDVP